MTFVSMSKHTPKQKGSETKLHQRTMGNFFTSNQSSKKRKTDMTTSWWVRHSERDTEQYRAGYPDKKDRPDCKKNLLFYTNELSSTPDGDLIDNIHEYWWGNHAKLERHHGYIQWIFPIREEGMNWQAQELQLHEAEAIQKDKEAHKRVLKSYKMMLDFYGMELNNEETGEIVRASNWLERFRHLNRSYHNYLRITRILKSLGELGYERLKYPFVKFILYEGIVENTLDNLLDSCMKYWIGVVKDKTQREELCLYRERLYKELEKEKKPKDFKLDTKQKDRKADTTEDDVGEDDTSDMKLIESDTPSSPESSGYAKASNFTSSRGQHNMSPSDDSENETSKTPEVDMDAESQMKHMKNIQSSENAGSEEISWSQKGAGTNNGEESLGKEASLEAMVEANKNKTDLKVEVDQSSESVEDNPTNGDHDEKSLEPTVPKLAENDSGQISGSDSRRITKCDNSIESEDSNRFSEAEANQHQPMEIEDCPSKMQANAD